MSDGTDKTIIDWLAEAYQRGWADGERKLRDDIAAGLREMADAKIIDPAKRSVIRLVAERVSCFPLRAEIFAEMKTEGLHDRPSHHR